MKRQDSYCGTRIARLRGINYLFRYLAVISRAINIPVLRTCPSHWKNKRAVDRVQITRATR